MMYEAGPWSVDPDTLANLRLNKAMEALQAGNHVDALLEAEELLDEDPNHLDALFIVAESALRMGDASMAKRAFGQLLQARPEAPELLAGLSVALFECAQLEEALIAATEATERAPDQAEGWYYRAMALERLGKPEEAETCFSRAHDIRPEAFPRRVKIPPESWVQALEHARAALPGPIRAFYNGIEIEWLDFPPMEALHAVKPHLSPFTDALYQGRPPADADPWVIRPKSIRLFRGNLGHPPPSQTELVQRISRALFNEALDWLGLSEQDIWPIS